MIAVASASPFVAGKDARHVELLSVRARAAAAVIASCNAVGGQDDLVFDGGSCVVARDGALLGACARFASDLAVVDLAGARPGASAAGDAGGAAADDEDVWFGLHGRILSQESIDTQKGDSHFQSDSH